MPRFKCMSCAAGFHSAAGLADLYDKTCSDCGALVELDDGPFTPQSLDERMGHLIARREVARAQARVDSERGADDAERASAGV